MIFSKKQLEEKGLESYNEGGFQYMGINLDKGTSRSGWLVTNDVDQFDDDPQFVVQLCLGNTPVVDKYLNSVEIDMIIKALSR